MSSNCKKISDKIQQFIKSAENGESVYIYEVRDTFEDIDSKVECIIETSINDVKKWQVPIPYVQSEEEKKFIENYFYSNIYNILSTYGGKQMTLCVPPDEKHIGELCYALNDIFQVNSKRIDRYGYGKCLNVTDRINAAFGHPPFKFYVTNEKIITKKENSGRNENKDVISEYRKTVKAASDKILIGLDIGGTDIKAIGTVNGCIKAIAEYDWNPAGMTRIEQMTAGIKNVMQEICDKLGKANIPDGVGVGFPDVVVMNKIVGGETLKTIGIRKASPDYESEFAKLLDLNEILLGYCKQNAVIQMTNDGSLAAYTAAVELAHSNRCGEVKHGIFAHTLGTELGTGWVDRSGQIPQIPLEIYNCVVDLGNYPAREFKPFDLRSTLNFSTKIAGTMQKYASQSGAYRLAVEYFSKDDPKLFKELFSRCFVEEKNNGIYVVVSPTDMRKPLLEYIMMLAEEGQPQAEKIFTEIGRHLAATWREVEFLLNPAAKERILYGRFVKSQKCLDLMRKGANEIKKITQKAGDDSLAFTPLMNELKENPNYTVAQFGQAIGAIHFIAGILDKD